jgi:hypothetical protein
MQLNSQTLAPIVDAMARSGIEREAIVMPPYMIPAGGNSNFATITATVKRPTEQLLQNALVDVGAAMQSLPNVTLTNAGAQLILDDCSALQNRARRDAISRAQKQAESIAETLGVHLGRAVAAWSSAPAPTPLQNANSCNTYTAFNSGAANVSRLSDYLQVHVYSSITITYAIR